MTSKIESTDISGENEKLIETEELAKAKSEENLRLLARQLALNYLDASAIDLFRRTDGKDEEEVLKVNLQNWRDIVFKDKAAIKYYSDKKETYTGRNILVLGAGCTYNAFSDIPLGDTVKMQILKEVTVWELPASYLPKKEDQCKRPEKELLTIDFLYFARFVLEYFRYKNLNKDEWRESSSYRYLCCSSCDQVGSDFGLETDKSNKGKHDFLYKIFSSIDINTGESVSSSELQEQHLLKGIGTRYYNELQRLNLVSPYVRDKEEERDEGKFRFRFDSIDFETSLFLLEQIIPVSMVRQLVKDVYNYSSGPVAFYELVAHLFKNRFIDVIINFNFDEFLDNALNDEMGRDGYEEILSDGDCRPLKEFSPEGRLRQPLYIKPHGTASHKSTLRFTKNHYHDTPLDMRSFLEEVISCKSEGDSKIEKHVNLITIGFNMESVEFNAILKQNLPKGSSVFSFFHHLPGKGGVEYDNTLKKLDLLFKNVRNIEETNSIEFPIYPIGHEFFGIGEYPIKIRLEEDESDKEIDRIKLHPDMPSLGNTMFLLYRQTQGLFKEPYKPRDINEHLIVNNLFGTEKLYESVRNKKKRECGKEEGRMEEKGTYPKSYFTSSSYYQDRVVLEILISLANNNGALDPNSLMKGRCGKYYAKYQETFAKEQNGTGEEYTNKSLLEFFEFGLSDALLDFKKILTGNGLLPYDKLKDESLQDTLTTIHANHEKLKKYKTDVEEIANGDKMSNAEIHGKMKILLDQTLSTRAEGDNGSLFSSEMQEYFRSYSETSDYYFLEQVILAFQKLIESQHSKVSSKFRSADHHVFANYETTNLLNTDLAMDLHFSKALNDKEKGEKGEKVESELSANTLLMVADTGVQFFKFVDEVFKYFDKVKIILAVPSRVISKIGKHKPQVPEDVLIELENRFFAACSKMSKMEECLLRDKIDVGFLDPDLHNEHMWLFVNEKTNGFHPPKEPWENRAIYYRKRGYSKYINPIRIVQPHNILRLRKLFELMWEDSSKRTNCAQKKS